MEEMKRQMASNKLIRKIVVFGGGGFIGSAVVDRLLEDGYDLRIFEHPRVKPYRAFSSSEKVEWYSGDMLSEYDISRAVAGMDAVLHLVSFTLPKNSNEDIIYDVQTNLMAALQLLNVMRSQRVGRIVFISSGGTVYGIPKYLPVDETHPTNPLVSYGITKLMIEKYLLLFQRLYGIKPVILRVSNAYGPRQRLETSQGAAGIFLNCFLNDLPVEIWGDGSVVRDYVYVDDVADAFAKALTYEGKESVFNISSAIGVSLNQLLQEIEALTQKSVTLKYLSGRSFDIPYNVLDNKLAARELGWSPRINLREGLLKTRDWLGEKGALT
jgi:UDP-glucose 4-epimerase